MNVRQAKKIINCQWINMLPYWWDRALDTFDGKRQDHRVVKAVKIIKRKRHE